MMESQEKVDNKREDFGIAEAVVIWVWTMVTCNLTEHLRIMG